MSTHRAFASGSNNSRALGQTIADFKRGMEIFVGTFTKSFGVRLVFQGTDAKTDGKTIYLPELALLERQNMTPAEEQEARDFLVCVKGYVYHECLHILHSDFTIIARILADHGPKFKILVNALEDQRIERIGAESFRGAKETLQATNEIVSGEALIAMKAYTAKKGESFPAWSQLLYAIMILGGFLGANGRKTDLWNSLDLPIRVKAKQFRAHIAEAVAAPSTGKLVVAAKKIWDLLSDEERKRGEEQEEEDGAGGEEGSAKTSKKKKVILASKGDGGDETDDGGGDDDEYIVFGLNDAVDDETTGGAEKAKILMVHIKQEVMRTSHKPNGVYRVYSTASDVFAPPPAPSTVAGLEYAKAFAKAVDTETRNIYGPMMRRLENLLRARKRSRQIFGLTDGTLDTNAIARLAVTHNHPSAALREQGRRVFRREIPGLALDNTAVLLSVDRSGSMSGPKCQLAMRCTHVLCSALHGVGVPVEVHSWSNKETHHLRAARDAKVETAMFSRYSALNVYRIKSFQEQWSLVQHRLPYLEADESNIDGESIQLGVRALLERREARKVLIVVCDGQPAGSGGDNNADLHEHLHLTVKNARAAGVEVYGLGICAPRAGQYYAKDWNRLWAEQNLEAEKRGYVDPWFTNITKIDDLPITFMKQLEAVLLPQ